MTWYSWAFLSSLSFCTLLFTTEFTETSAAWAFWPSITRPLPRHMHIHAPTDSITHSEQSPVCRPTLHNVCGPTDWQTSDGSNIGLACRVWLIITMVSFRNCNVLSRPIAPSCVRWRRRSRCRGKRGQRRRQNGQPSNPEISVVAGLHLRIILHLMSRDACDARRLRQPTRSLCITRGGYAHSSTSV